MSSDILWDLIIDDCIVSSGNGMVTRTPSYMLTTDSLTPSHVSLQNEKVFINSEILVNNFRKILLRCFFTTRRILKKHFFDCSRKKFVAIILVLLVFFYAVFRRV